MGNIIDNNQDAFDGNRLVIFYAKDLGLWPYYTNFDINQPVNGGVPQVGASRFRNYYYFCNYYFKHLHLIAISRKPT